MRAIDISGGPSLFGFTRYEWRVFFVVWLGWALDATDFSLFSLVLKPAVTEILCAVMTFFATLSLLAVLIGPETRHQELPE
jgi:hypothetical protein